MTIDLGAHERLLDNIIGLLQDYVRRPDVTTLLALIDPGDRVIGGEWRSWRGAIQSALATALIGPMLLAQQPDWTQGKIIPGQDIWPPSARCSTPVGTVAGSYEPRAAHAATTRWVWKQLK
jgi:hypothetical protein